jgi:dolichol kinase
MQNDLLGLLIVYIYVSFLLLLTEKIFKKYPNFSRKILHIMTGNIAFFLPIFQTRYVMAFMAAGPFIFFTFLMSPYSPIKLIKGKTSAAGHGMGLVYYAITWTILAYLFFDNMIVIAIAILAMSYGDGFASVIGMKFGKRKYRIFGDEKSYIGSYAMFILTFFTSLIAIIYYNYPITQINIIYILIISLIVTVIEGLTPKGLDNLSVPFLSAFIYWILFFM